MVAPTMAAAMTSAVMTSHSTQQIENSHEARSCLH